MRWYFCVSDCSLWSFILTIWGILLQSNRVISHFAWHIKAYCDEAQLLCCGFKSITCKKWLEWVVWVNVMKFFNSQIVNHNPSSIFFSSMMVSTWCCSWDFWKDILCLSTASTWRLLPLITRLVCTLHGYANFRFIWPTVLTWYLSD